MRDYFSLHRTHVYCETKSHIKTHAEINSHDEKFSRNKSRNEIIIMRNRIAARKLNQV